MVLLAVAWLPTGLDRVDEGLCYLSFLFCFNQWNVRGRLDKVEERGAIGLSLDSYALCLYNGLPCRCVLHPL
jgi:hypothetical protein